jgi:(p)ppGpp synthase/HD superfamily hydrolase
LSSNDTREGASDRSCTWSRKARAGVGGSLRRSHGREEVSNLERAIEIAAAAHARQTDKAGAPYILHPLRVALGFIRTGDEERAIIAVLHDVIEDSDVTAADLRRGGFSEPIVEAVVALTRPEGEAYRDFIMRAAANELARPVKIADLKDNLNRTRLAQLPAEKREKLLAKYDGALEILGE